MTRCPTEARRRQLMGHTVHWLQRRMRIKAFAAGAQMSKYYGNSALAESGFKTCIYNDIIANKGQRDRRALLPIKYQLHCRVGAAKLSHIRQTVNLLNTQPRLSPESLVPAAGQLSTRAQPPQTTRRGRRAPKLMVG